MVLLVILVCMKRASSKKGFIAPLLLIIGLILCLVLVGFFSQNIKHAYTPVSPAVPVPESTISASKPEDPEESSGEDIVCGIIVQTPTEGQAVGSPLVVQGYVNGCGWIANDTGLAYVGLYSSTGTAITTDVPVSIIGSTTGTSVSFVTTLVYPDTTSSLSGYLLFRSASDPSLTYKRNVKY